MRRFPRWIELPSPHATLADAARRSIRIRLKAVRYFLKRAARQAHEDAEYVHQLRVETRRAEAALQLYRPWISRTEVRGLRRRLRQLRRAAGAARDLDVLDFKAREIVPLPKPMLRELGQRRRAAQKPLRRLDRRLRASGRLRRKTRRAIRSVDDAAHRIRFADWAGRELHDALDTFFQRAAPQNWEIDTLHRLRIDAKKLRYTIELLAASAPAALRQPADAILKQLQQRLGAIHDHTVTLDQFAQCGSLFPDASGESPAVAREQQALDSAVAAFRQAWTVESIAEARARLAALADALAGQSGGST